MRSRAGTLPLNLSNSSFSKRFPASLTASFWILWPSISLRETDHWGAVQAEQPLQQGCQWGTVKPATPCFLSVSVWLSHQDGETLAGVVAGNNSLSHKQTCLLLSALNREFGHIHTEFQLIDPNKEWWWQIEQKEAGNNSFLIMIIQWA